MQSGRTARSLTDRSDPLAARRRAGAESMIDLGERGTPAEAAASQGLRIGRFSRFTLALSGALAAVLTGLTGGSEARSPSPDWVVTTTVTSQGEETSEIQGRSGSIFQWQLAPRSGDTVEAQLIRDPEGKREVLVQANPVDRRSPDNIKGASIPRATVVIIPRREGATLIWSNAIGRQEIVAPMSPTGSLYNVRSATREGAPSGPGGVRSVIVNYGSVAEGKVWPEGTMVYKSIPGLNRESVVSTRGADSQEGVIEDRRPRGYQTFDDNGDLVAEVQYRAPAFPGQIAFDVSRKRERLGTVRIEPIHTAEDGSVLRTVSMELAGHTDIEQQLRLDQMRDVITRQLYSCLSDSGSGLRAAADALERAVVVSGGVPVSDDVTRLLTELP